MKKRLLAGAGAVIAATAISSAAFAVPPPPPGHVAVCASIAHEVSAINTTLANPKLGNNQKLALQHELAILNGIAEKDGCTT